MIDYSEIYPDNPQLGPYIESFVIVRLNTPEIDSKLLLSRPGASLLFSSIPLVVNRSLSDTSVVIGIGTKPSLLEWEGTSSGYGLLVKFSPYGLSRFTTIPIPSLVNTATAASKLLGNSVHQLTSQLVNTDDVTGQIELVEDFLMARLIEPTETDRRMFKLADALKDQLDPDLEDKLVHGIPLSKRHIERRFKALIGFSRQTYTRICHFDHAKSLLMEPQHGRLTEIGYRSGYFDQAHFSREFKRFAVFNPKVFFQAAPFYKWIAHSKK